MYVCRETEKSTNWYPLCVCAGACFVYVYASQTGIIQDFRIGEGGCILVAAHTILSLFSQNITRGEGEKLDFNRGNLTRSLLLHEN